jgi:hypothetical protein
MAVAGPARAVSPEIVRVSLLGDAARLDEGLL